MPPIHREKSLDEYCITSNASNQMKNKRNQIWNSTNNAKMARLSVPMDEDSSRTKRVSEGSSNSNCSSSSDNHAESNNMLQSPPASKNNLAYSCSSSSNSGMKSNRLYSSNNSNSNFQNCHSNDSIPYSDSVENKSINCMKAKAVINDIKMELKDAQHHEQHRDFYFQNNSKETPMQQNYTNNPFPFPTTSHFQPANLPSQF